MTIRRIAGRNDCGNCYRPYKLFETVHYLGIDNNSFCAGCREKLAPGEPDDVNDLFGGWIPSLYVGGYNDGRENILKLIELWNDRLDEYDDQRIDVSK